jgi:retron-type reverse transcriptase
MIEEILDPECPQGRASAIPKEAKPSRMDGAQRSQNLAAAWRRVKANKGAPGIDGMTVGDFPAFAREHWPRIAAAIRESGWKEGRRHAVECDLKSFFDTVSHDRLMNALREKVRCREVLGLVRRYLMAGVELPDGTREATPQGVPQGGPLSPLFWKQWKQPRTRRRNLLALGADPGKVHMATRSRKGYWRMSQNEIVRFALNNRWIEEQGVPDMRAVWIVLHYGPDARV